jgi:hypothetical protein
MKPPRTTSQSIAQRDALLEYVEQKGSGYLFILDMDHREGRAAAGKLKIYEDVARALTVRIKQNLLHCRYMMVLLPFAADGHAVVAFATADNLTEGVELLHQRSQAFGKLFAVIICPPDPQIAALCTTLQETAGSA